LVERVKISTTNFVCKDASGNVTFDATRKYLKTTATGQGTVKLGGYRNCPVSAGRYSSGNLVGYYTYPNAGAFQCELYGLDNYSDAYGAAQTSHNAVQNGLTSQPMEYRFPFGMTNVFQPTSGVLTHSPMRNHAYLAPYTGSTRIFGAATITGTSNTFPVAIYIYEPYGYYNGNYNLGCIAKIENFSAAPIGQGVSATLYFPNLNAYSWRRTSDNADLTSYARTYAANGWWYLQTPTYLSGPPEDFDLTVTA
jgi:hypothetical protein